MRSPSGDSPREEGRDLHERPRAVAQMMAAPERMPSRALGADESARVQQQAIMNGFKGAGLAGANCGSLMFLVNLYSPSFRKGVGISGKVGLVMIPTFGTFLLLSHLTVAHAVADPFEYMNDVKARR